jgi:DNA replication protein DnaC
VNTLLDGSFIERCENILAFGNPGSGKTHLLCAIAQELINRDKRIFFTPCSLLVQELLVAKRDLVLPKALKKLASYDALLINDIGYVQQNREEMEVLFTLLAILLRKKQRNTHQQFTIFTVGEDFQGSNDHSSSH